MGIMLERQVWQEFELHLSACAYAQELLAEVVATMYIAMNKVVLLHSSGTNAQAFVATSTWAFAISQTIRICTVWLADKYRGCPVHLILPI